MSFVWKNRFNGIEDGGPFETAALAKADAVSTYVECQGGFAFDIVIEEGKKIVAEGFIRNGVWCDGEFHETAKDQAERMAAA